MSSRTDEVVDPVASAEIAFALDAQDRTVSDAFLAALAPGSIMFRPTPVDAIASLRQRPISPDFLLIWTPELTEIAGDLAVSTGPSQYGKRGSAPSGTGHFLSVWRKLPHSWQVVIDAAIAGPISMPFAIGELPVVSRGGNTQSAFPQDTVLARATLMREEEQLIGDYVGRIAAYAAEDMRVYRNGALPADGYQRAAPLLVNESKTAWVPGAAVVARSGKLGYVYGVAQNGDTTGYLRIWRRVSDQWRVAYDLR